MKISAGLAAGLAGTLTVASVHEALRRVSADAPRMDILDVELIKKGLKCINKEVPAAETLQRWAVAGEVFCDTAYYSLVAVGSKKDVWLRGASLGLFAGATAVILPGPLGLPEEASNKSISTQLMTIGLYLIGGLAAAVVAKLVDKSQSNSEPGKSAVPGVTYDQFV